MKGARYPASGISVSLPSESYTIRVYVATTKGALLVSYPLESHTACCVVAVAFTVWFMAIVYNAWFSVHVAMMFSAVGVLDREVKLNPKVALSPILKIGKPDVDAGLRTVIPPAGNRGS